MLKDTLSKIESAITRLESLGGGEKKELAALLEKLKTEVGTLPPELLDKANSMANFAQAATHETTRGDRDNELLDLSIKGLSHSVRSFEASHPVLVDTVNDICLMLARIGI